MLTLVRPAAALLGLLTLITGVAYPLAVTGAAQTLFRAQANGSLVYRHGRPTGSLLIGQQFVGRGYFWGRPSATSPHAYNAAASAGSNLGPSNAALLEAVRKRVGALRAAHPERAAVPVPVDLVTASGSGLDPHLSPAAAFYQVGRVARERGLLAEDVGALVAQQVERRPLGVLGEPLVNVLSLNLALDALARSVP